jgi:RNA 2',3'-cyclic 3'-phosphodiesterase
MARTRTFLGVAVGDEIRSAAAALQQTLGRCGATVNWVPRENMHVTLLFLGEVDERDLPGVCRAVTRATANEPPFELRVSGVGAFPTPRRPKTIWAGTTDGTAELTRLYAALETPLMDTGAYRREDRAYTPHLTLGRVKSEADGQVVAAELPKYLAWPGGRTVVDEVLVYASDLRREGPEYTVLARGPLRGRDGSPD